MRDLVFFYGTLMAGFDRRRRAGIDGKLAYVGRGSIEAALFEVLENQKLIEGDARLTLVPRGSDFLAQLLAAGAKSQRGAPAANG